MGKIVPDRIFQIIVVTANRNLIPLLLRAGIKHMPQFLAVSKGYIPDLSNTFRNDDRIQIAAAKEHAFRDKFQAFGKLNILQ